MDTPTSIQTKLLICLLFIVGILACKKEQIEVPNALIQAETYSALLGGQASINDATPRAFSSPIPGLSNEEELDFFVGNTFFNKVWVSSPASTTASDGLGPFFNAKACSNCHFKDGRGRAPEFMGESSTGYLLRLSTGGLDEFGATLPHPNYGGQLQDHSIQGVPKEADFSVTYEMIQGKYEDGTTYELRKPVIQIFNENYGPLGRVNVSPRVANQMIGLGLLEAIPERKLLALSDPTDADGDGISGRPNYVWDYQSMQRTIGRFGWKANQPNLYQQACGAASGDMGITTQLFKKENCTSVQKDCQNAANGGTPELEEEDLISMVNYTRTLAVPVQRKPNDPNTVYGRRIFEALNCNGCHVMKLETGIHVDVPALSNQKIQPYTDLLLHDMGEGLADHTRDFLATGTEWRTPPLWGIGLFEVVNGHTNYLHDGRARNLEEAILWHGGEAEQTISRFRKLPKKERELLIGFLNTL